MILTFISRFSSLHLHLHLRGIPLKTPKRLSSAVLQRTSGNRGGEHLAPSSGSGSNVTAARSVDDGDEHHSLGGILSDEDTRPSPNQTRRRKRRHSQIVSTSRKETMLAVATSKPAVVARTSRRRSKKQPLPLHTVGVSKVSKRRRGGGGDGGGGGR
eukprot:COSAG05_NODE_795_length_7281_cov_33.551100_2_plen_157_part_00